MGPILEADLASLEGELSNSQIESNEEDREQDRDSLTIVENAVGGGRNSEDDDESEKGGDNIAELGSSVHSLSRLAHYNPDGFAETLFAIVGRSNAHGLLTRCRV